MFKSARLFFIYLAWFVGIVIIVYGAFSLVLGTLYLTVPETQKTIGYGGLFGLFGGGPLMMEEEMMAVEDAYMYMPPYYQEYLESPEKMEKLSPEERKKFEEAYKKAEKKMEKAKESMKKSQREYRKGAVTLTFAKGITGLVLGIPLVWVTWVLGKKEKNAEV